MKIFVIAGEASGDLHGSNLIKQLKRLRDSIEIECWGGDKMKVAGGRIKKHIRDLAFMGFYEVIANLRTILGNFKLCKSQISTFEPDAIVLIDYPGFNLRMAKWAHEQNIPVFYYISPQLWAWRSSRVQQIKDYVNKMFVILPFEKEFYERFNYPVEYVGHPLKEVVQNIPPLNSLKSAKPLIALLPGSRNQEIKSVLPQMLSIVNDFPKYDFAIAMAPNQEKSFYESIISQSECQIDQVHLIADKTYSLIKSSRAALVTSGTATLETAMIGTPQVVCYKGNTLSYLIARRVIKVKYISLVNLILDQALVKELIQVELNRSTLKSELSQILSGPKREALIKGYNHLNELLGDGDTSKQVAQQIIHAIESPR